MSAPVEIMSTPDLAALAARIEHIAQQVADDGHPTIIRLVRWYIAEASDIAAERDRLVRQVPA